MKKVLAIAPYPYLPFFSGGQKFIAQFFEWLGQSIDLTVIASAENETGLAKSYRIIPLLKKSFTRYMDRSLVKKITALVQQEKFDTLICEHPYFAWLVFAVRKRTGVRVIIHTHNIEYQRFRSTGKWWWPVLKSYEKKSFQKADAVFFISPEDKAFAINSWGIPANKCIDLPFGIDIKAYPVNRDASRQLVARQHGIGENEKILLFNGLLNYQPNIDALQLILETINPLLLKATSFRYKIIICGKGLPAGFHALKDYADKNIIYAGFVDDIGQYLSATAVFLNPVQSGGGVKTKMVEAIAYGATVIATETAAAGINREAAGNKLVVSKDGDWNRFAQHIMEATDTGITPRLYYEEYYWGNIIRKITALHF